MQIPLRHQPLAGLHPAGPLSLGTAKLEGILQVEGSVQREAVCKNCPQGCSCCSAPVVLVLGETSLSLASCTNSFLPNTAQERNFIHDLSSDLLSHTYFSVIQGLSPCICLRWVFSPSYKDWRSFCLSIPNKATKVLGSMEENWSN